MSLDFQSETRGLESFELKIYFEKDTFKYTRPFFESFCQDMAIVRAWIC